MAGKSDVFENDFLRLIFNNVSIATIGDATGVQASATAGSLFVSLHSADPTDAGNQTSSEATYTSYARVAVARTAGGWTVTGNSVSPTNPIIFPTATGGSTTVTHFAVGTAASGTGKILFAGPATPSITVTNGITPQIGTATTIVED